MTSSSRLVDSQRSRALLVGNGYFEPGSGLSELPTVLPGLHELRRLLTDPVRGALPESRCHVLADPMDPDIVDAKLTECVDEAEDTLIFYYAGHGIPHPRDGALHLALGHTARRRLHATAFPISWLRNALVESSALAKVVILDCCFSGRAIQPMSSGQLAEEVDVAGSFVMTAASANTPALAPEGAPFTAFTGAIIRVLREGAPDAGEYLDLETLFRQLRASLREQGFPEPQAQRMNEAAHLALCRNVITLPVASTRSEAPERLSDAQLRHDSQAMLLEMLELLLERPRSWSAENDLRLELSESMKHQLITNAWDPELGARPLRLAVRDWIEDPLVDLVPRLKPPAGATLLFEVGDEEGTIKVSIIEPRSHGTQ